MASYLKSSTGRVLHGDQRQPNFSVNGRPHSYLRRGLIQADPQHPTFGRDRTAVPPDVVFRSHRGTDGSTRGIMCTRRD